MIESWSRGHADDCMPEAMLVETLAKVARHPWHHARSRLTLGLLKSLEVHPPASILEVGCGWGLNLSALERAGYAVTGTDISRNILEKIDKPERRLIEADLNQPLPPDAGEYEAVLALDVIEHLDDDQGAVRQMARLLRPGGVAIISVPALPELFSHFDEIQGHRRRYLPETLRRAVEGGGLEVLRIFWWGAWMVPILRRTRLHGGAGTPARLKTYADYLTLPAWPGPPLLRLAYAIEEKFALRGSLKTGTSLFAVARTRC
jgi:SAM-dependent methyltransferase